MPDLNTEHKEILEQSFQLMRKAYEEANASFESINIRCGVALAFIGTAISTANFEIWVFAKPPYLDGWFTWLIVDVLNLASLCLLTCGTIAILYGLQVKKHGSIWKARG